LYEFEFNLTWSLREGALVALCSCH